MTAHGLKSPWNQINCPNSMASAICGALPVAELRSPPQPQVIKSLSLCGVRTVASGCPRGSERGLGFVSVSIQWKPFRYTTSHLRGTGQHSGYLPGRANADAPKRLLLFKLKIFIGGLQPPARPSHMRQDLPCQGQQLLWSTWTHCACEFKSFWVFYLSFRVAVSRDSPI